MRKRLKRVFTAIIAALVLAVCALCGCVNDASSSSYEWILSTIEKYYYEDIPRSELHGKILSGGLPSVLDKYSAYYTKEEYAQIAASNSGSKSGLGVSYQYLQEGVSERGSGVLIISVTGGSPAFESGLKAGTFVKSLRLDGVNYDISSSSDFSSFITERATGEEFTLVTDRGEYEVSKQSYTASYCTMSTSQKTYSFHYENGARVLDEEEGGNALLPDGAAYLKLDQFYGNAVGEFADLIGIYNEKNCSSLILDLRQNGGGYVDVMCGISGIFGGQLGKSGTVAMTATYKNGTTDTFKIGGVASGKEFPSCTNRGKVSVLADNSTASASEALIGTLISLGVMDYSDVYISDFGQDYLTFTNTAEKNRRTYGKGIMQSTFINKKTGEVLKLTTAKIYWPNGVCIHDTGLTDEKCSTVKTDWCVTYGDEQLAKAIELIYG